MADVKWIKIVTDIFDDEKIYLIEDLPEADSIIVIWFKLLCLAGKQNNCGVFMLNDKIPYTEKMLASIFRRKESTIQLALHTFENLGMIEVIDGVITIPNWEKHQDLKKLEMVREQTRQRVAKHRENQRLLSCNADVQNCSVNCNVNITQTDKIRLDKNKSIFKEYTNSASLISALEDFEKMRKSIKKPLTDRAKTMLLTELDKLTNDDNTKIAILNQSIFHNWQGVFPLKANQETIKKTTGNPFLDLIESGVFDE